MSATSSNSATYPVTDPFWSDILQFGPGIKCVTSESDNGTQFPMVPKRLGDYARFTVAEELGDAVTALAQALHAFNPQN